VSLFDKLKLDELSQALRDLPFNKHQPSRKDIAHFCEHDGICVRFTPARTTWQALAPCALKPWWLFLKPLHKNTQKNMQTKLTQQQEKQKEENTNKITTKNADLEVTENA
jgi:hypothetical protein